VQLAGLCPTVHAAFAHHTNVRCRVAYYDLLAWLYEHRPDTDAALRATWRVRSARVSMYPARSRI